MRLFNRGSAGLFFAGVVLLVLASCNVGNKTAAPTPTPAATPDFSLSVTPAAQSVTAGGATVQLSLLATASGGFSSTVAVAVGGLGSGVTTSPATISLTPGMAATVTIAADVSAGAGTETVTFTGTSGTLSHAAIMTLTVAAAPVPTPDFSLGITPATQTITAGGAGVQISLLATASGGFNAPVTVAVSGLGGGVTTSPAAISLVPGTASAVTIAAAANVAAGAETITFTGTSGSLSHAATLTLTVAPVQANSAGLDVTTYHYDNTRQGWNQQETILTTENVTSSTFGLKGMYPLDGKVDAAPLYLGNVTLAGGTSNVLYVATEHDSVYALDPPSGNQIWKTSLKAGETTSDIRGCGQISPEKGITSTPVIDRAYGSHGAIFVVAMTKDAHGGYHHRLHALDLTTGEEVGGGPTEIAARYPGTGANSSGGQVVFDPSQYAERAGLLLLNGTIYLAWTSNCDIQPYTGWVMGYSEATLQQTSVLNLTPNGSEGAIWMSGYGMAADTDGNIYFLDANGTLDTEFDSNGFPANQDYGNAMLKLSTASGLKVADYWEPYNSHEESVADRDLGSGGGMLLPDMPDKTGTMRRLLVGAGKSTKIYVADCNNMGKFNATDDSNLYQEIPRGLSGGAWSGPAYFNHIVFYGGVNDPLRAFPVSDAMLATTPSSVSATSFAYPGTTPSVSSNGPNEGIVWAVESATDAAAVLHAYDATNLGNELYNSNQAASSRDSFGNGNKFITPVVTNGMVFIGTPNGVAVFGLLP